MQALIDWIVAHQAVVAGVGVAILDLVFALMPKWASNGILDWVYQQVKKLASKSPPAS